MKPQSMALLQVENASSEGAVSGRSGDWSEVAVPVPFISSFTSTWHYTFTNLQSSTVYDVVGMGEYCTEFLLSCVLILINSICGDA